jgi:hypothetical protein
MAANLSGIICRRKVRQVAAGYVDDDDDVDDDDSYYYCHCHYYNRKLIHERFIVCILVTITALDKVSPGHILRFTAMHPH